jgi:ComF family protein
MACDGVLEGETYFCERCDLGVEAIGVHACLACGEPGVFKTDRCLSCRRAPWRLGRARAPFLHQGAVAKAVHRFKYEDHSELGWRLARWAYQEEGDKVFEGHDVICAIPLHRARFFSRGYDQATLLAAEFAQCAGLPLKTLLHRQRATARQVGLTDAQRELNLRGAFRASSDASRQSILLIDDVLTTGATGNAAAKVLYEAGARRVELLTLARARKTDVEP